ncbi:GGDEF domain-containing protein [Hansschlegelia plantiphila]|uniref:GGDEF domain-containing protein n=1 Tax=Hansschlegelia plantiphila TaxID=374655 RepID=A0A9W6J0F1_9HYPH|nr:diguanylate cyclase [Hansschlegelia plantiphila]GLK67118.1 GGDEF domain-containing protein [Hansschlegelia plantiphila]
MRDKLRTFSLPTWAATRWLAHAGQDVPLEIQRALVASLFGTLPIFAGGVINSTLVAAIAAARMQTAPFIGWLACEILLCVVRLAALLISFRRSEQRRTTPTDLYLVLGVLWSASVGYGTFISILSGDWAVAALACLSTGAMVGGICFRNFGAPRLAAAMTLCSMGPICAAAPFAGDPVFLAAFLQIPFYIVSMRIAALKLNGLLVATMRAEREHEHQARHDPLTGLPNRAGLRRAMVARRERSVALLYLDLDGFKAINDSHGHGAGDRLLNMAAERLRRLLRTDDVAARIGGDEFVVLVHGLDRTQAPAFAERLIHSLSAVYQLEPNVTVRIGVSVGVALAPDHGDELSELLDAADAALYRAKTSGKNCCVVAPSLGAAESA